MTSKLDKKNVQILKRKTTSLWYHFLFFKEPPICPSLPFHYIQYQVTELLFPPVFRPNSFLSLQNTAHLSTVPSLQTPTPPRCLGILDRKNRGSRNCEEKPTTTGAWNLPIIAVIPIIHHPSRWELPQPWYAWVESRRAGEWFYCITTQFLVGEASDDLWIWCLTVPILWQK